MQLQSIVDQLLRPSSYSDVVLIALKFEGKIGFKKFSALRVVKFDTW